MSTYRSNHFNRSDTPYRLKHLLEQGVFVLTTDCTAPLSGNAAGFIGNANRIKDHVDAVGVTDNFSSTAARMSALACALHLKTTGLEPILPLTVHDRNRIALQADILGAASFDIHNFLCFSGAPKSSGAPPPWQVVQDLKSLELISGIAAMRDKGKVIEGWVLDQPIQAFIGAMINPFGSFFDRRLPQLQEKIRIGANFIRIQSVFNLKRFENWMKEVRNRGLDQQTHFIATVTLLRSAGMARYIQNRIQGMDLPEPLIQRLGGESESRQIEEGMCICLEIMARLMEIPGINGIHIQAPDMEERIPELIERAGLFPRL